MININKAEDGERNVKKKKPITFENERTVETECLENQFKVTGEKKNQETMQKFWVEEWPCEKQFGYRHSTTTDIFS